jgi:electron transport complex protein RnfG
MTPTGPMIKVLGTVSLLCGALIVVTNLTTHARIQQNQEIIMRDSVTHLLPGLEKSVVYSIEENGELKVLKTLEGENIKRLFAGFDKDNHLLGVVLEAKERGYGDVISAMYAYAPDKKVITGFQVVEAKETPGLGSRIGSDPDFLENFKALDASDPAKNPIKAVKHGTKKNAWEIDAISGATISSRAVGRMLQNSALEMGPIVEKNLDRIRRGN